MVIQTPGAGMSRMVDGRRRCGATARRLVAAAAVIVAVGCGRSGLPGAVPVKGRVTFAGGACPHPGYVCFLPAEQQPSQRVQPRAGSGRFDRDGGFEVTTLVPGDGLVPGAYRPRVICEGAADDDLGRSLVPADFSPPLISVSAGDGPAVWCEIDVPVAASSAFERGRR